VSVHQRIAPTTLNFFLPDTVNFVGVGPLWTHPTLQTHWAPLWARCVPIRHTMTASRRSGAVEQGASADARIGALGGPWGLADVGSAGAYPWVGGEAATR
jgi:hypothetical protein